VTDSTHARTSAAHAPAPAPGREDAIRRLDELSVLRLHSIVTPVEEMNRLRAELRCAPRLLIKRDDAIPFGFGGNKVRKLESVLAEALRSGTDTLVTLGGVQSNHARATAAAAAKLGLHCVIIANGVRPDPPTGNALIVDLLGAEVITIASRDERAAATDTVMERLRSEGRTPFLIPLGASTPLGALGFVRAVAELVQQNRVPSVIVHASSSGGTQAGLALGCALHGLTTRVLGISSDEPAAHIRQGVRAIIAGAAELLGLERDFAESVPLEVDDTFIGDGYGVPTPASHEAQRLAARLEAFFVDHTYTAKAFAGMIAYLRAHEFDAAESVMFWHTGGQVGLFA
jgi:1-aminocyclopropane-1-carboxylate deaminase/D-cysteine desulfhydrase-like pyridoxal-dependent ACC family enzyme